MLTARFNKIFACPFVVFPKKYATIFGSLLLTVLCTTHGVMAQHKESGKPKRAIYLDSRIENGLVLNDGSEKGKEVANSTNYAGLDFRLSFRNTDTTDVYSTVYRRPYLGIGLYGGTFHSDIIGDPLAVYFFFNIPFKFEKSKHLSFSYSCAVGYSFNANPYDPVENPDQIFLGSSVNSYVNFALSANYKFSPRWAINGSLGFKHFSNGAIKLPNLGVNVVPLTLGLSYKLNKPEVHTYPTYVKPYKKNNVANITLLGGSKNYIDNGPNYAKIGVSTTFLRQINYKYRLGFGLDVVWCEGANDRNTSDASDFSKSMSFAITGSWEWVITKNLYIPIDLGFYLHRNEENLDRRPYYERIGIRYRIKDHYNIGFAIKAHENIADIFEFSIGYTFHKDPNW